MSFNPDISVTGATGEVSVYSEISLTNGKSIRRDSGRELATPSVLTISHELSGKAPNVSDRHLVRFDHTVASPQPDSIDVATVSAYLVLQVPRGRIITKEVVVDVLAKLMSFLSPAEHVDKLLNGEP